jgi:hypothetical protein
MEYPFRDRLLLDVDEYGSELVVEAASVDTSLLTVGAV